MVFIGDLTMSDNDKNNGETLELSQEMQNDPTIRMMLKLGIKPNQESFLNLGYTDQEVTGELLANLPDFFHDLPKN